MVIYEIPLSFKIKSEYLKAIAEGNGFIPDLVKMDEDPNYVPTEQEYLNYITNVVAPQALLNVSSQYVLEEVKNISGVEKAAKQVMEQENILRNEVNQLAINAITPGTPKII